MKKLIVIFLLNILVINMIGQIRINANDNIVPFSQRTRYQIDLEKTKQLFLPSYNNDSIYDSFNSNKSISSNVLATGIVIDTCINLLEAGTKIEIEEGNIWILNISSKTAEGLNPYISLTDMPEGSYLAIYSANRSYNDLELDKLIVTKENLSFFKGRSITKPINSNRIIIEYFEPNEIEGLNELIINKIVYKFHSRLKKKDTKTGTHVNQSGGALSCQTDVVCGPEAVQWYDESNCVLFIELDFLYFGGSYTYTSTGFFINKVGDYGNNDFPYFVTAGHLFFPEISPGLFVDISNTYNPNNVTAYVNYLNPSCNSTVLVPGNVIGAVDRLSLGLNYRNTDPQNASDDYSFWKTIDFNVSELTIYGVRYAGWTRFQDFSIESGYVSLSHPKGDVLKYMKDEDYAIYQYGNRLFGLYFDIGASEKGSSGGPIFNMDKKVVGFINSGDIALSCSDSYNTHGGLFYDLWENIDQYIDPNGVETADDFYPTNSHPDHCYNCILDVDEINIDCGGSCTGCGISAITIVKTEEDIIDYNKALARNYLEIDQSSSNSLFYSTNSYEFKAGETILLSSGLKIPLGKSVSIITDDALLQEPYRGCSSPCISITNTFSPYVLDGINDLWPMVQANIIYYDLVIFDRYGAEIYSKFSAPVARNGVVYLYDGIGLDPAYQGTPLYYVLTYTDCFHNDYVKRGYVYVF